MFHLSWDDVEITSMTSRQQEFQDDLECLKICGLLHCIYEDVQWCVVHELWQSLWESQIKLSLETDLTYQVDVSVECWMLRAVQDG